MDVTAAMLASERAVVVKSQRDARATWTQVASSIPYLNAMRLLKHS
jgi:hypothetical protein